VYLNI